MAVLIEVLTSGNIINTRFNASCNLRCISRSASCAAAGRGSNGPLGLFLLFRLGGFLNNLLRGFFSGLTGRAGFLEGFLGGLSGLAGLLGGFLGGLTGLAGFLGGFLGGLTGRAGLLGGFLGGLTGLAGFLEGFLGSLSGLAGLLGGFLGGLTSRAGFLEGFFSDLTGRAGFLRDFFGGLSGLTDFLGSFFGDLTGLAGPTRFRLRNLPSESLLGNLSMVRIILPIRLCFLFRFAFFIDITRIHQQESLARQPSWYPNI